MSQDHDTGQRPLASFEPKRLDGVDALRKLAPIAAGRGLAIHVACTNGEWFADGLVAVGRPGFRSDPYFEFDDSGHRAVCYMLRAEGPGHLRCYVFSEKHTLELRLGRITKVRPFMDELPVKQWLAAAGKALAERCVAMNGPTARGEFERFPKLETKLIEVVWRAAIVGAVEARHGGAFVLLPDDEPLSLIDLKFKTPSYDVAEPMLEYWRGCFQLSEAEKTNPKLVSAFRLGKHFAWSRVLAQADALTTMSAVDGCVVLSRTMRLHGFGGEIRVPDTPGSSAKPLLDGETSEPIDDLAKLGTRHRSAARLCLAVPGTTVLVVSQDGDLRVFHSDHTAAYRVGPLCVDPGAGRL